MIGNPITDSENSFSSWKRGKQAMESFEVVIRLQPTNFAAHLDLMRACNQAEDFDRTIEVAETAAKLDFTIHGLFHLRGIALYSKKKYEHAIDDLSEAVRINPKAESSFYYRAKAFKGSNLYDKALADVEAALKIKPDLNEALVLQAELNKLLGVKEETNSTESNQDESESAAQKKGDE